MTGQVVDLEKLYMVNEERGHRVEHTMLEIVLALALVLVISELMVLMMNQLFELL